VGHNETLLGASNRMKNLKQVMGNTRFDILVSIENGIFPVQIEDRQAWFDLGWIIVEDVNGTRRFSHSTGIEFDAQYVEEARRRGFEKTTVGSIIAEHRGIDSTDPHSPLTTGNVSRAAILKQALKAAFGQLPPIPFTSEDHPEQPRQKFSTDHVIGRIQRICKGYNIPGVIPHGLRVHFEALALETGHDLAKIMAWAHEELDRFGK